MLLFRYPDATQAIKRAVRWESTPSHEPVPNGPGQRYAASKIIKIFTELHRVRYNLLTYLLSLSLFCVSVIFRFYAEKSSDATLWFPSVCLCFVATSVLWWADASWDGSISAEQLNEWLYTAGRTIWPPRYTPFNALC